MGPAQPVFPTSLVIPTALRAIVSPGLPKPPRLRAGGKHARSGDAKSAKHVSTPRKESV